MFSRPIALIGATTLLVVGFIVTATAPTVEAYAAAQVLSTMGSTGIDLRECLEPTAAVRVSY